MTIIDKAKEAIKDGLKGATEGAGKKVAEAGIETATGIAGEGAKAIKTRLFGLGKGDEAKFSLALGTLEEGKRTLIIDFLETLSSGEHDGFRQTIAEMDTKNGGVILQQYAQLPNHEERRRRGEAAGLIKAPPWEKIDLKTADQEIASGLQTLADKIKSKYERR